MRNPPQTAASRVAVWLLSPPLSSSLLLLPLPPSLSLSSSAVAMIVLLFWISCLCLLFIAGFSWLLWRVSSYLCAAVIPIWICKLSCKGRPRDPTDTAAKMRLHSALLYQFLYLYQYLYQYLSLYLNLDKSILKFANVKCQMSNVKWQFWPVYSFAKVVLDALKCMWSCGRNSPEYCREPQLTNVCTLNILKFGHLLKYLKRVQCRFSARDYRLESRKFSKNHWTV